MRSQIYIGRQPVLKDDGKTILGYEILFRKKDEESAGIVNNLHATANVIENLLEIGLDKIIENNLGLIKILPDFLHNFALDLLPKEKFVFEILDESILDKSTLKIMEHYKRMGYRFALDDFVFTQKKEQAIAYADYIKINTKSLSKEEVIENVGILKKYAVPMLAEKVETVEEFYYYKKMGFKFFQGYFFEKPSIFTSETISPKHDNLLRIIRGFQENEKISEIEKLFKSSPELVYRLIRLVNSPVLGLTGKISSLRQAIVMLGYDTVCKWLLTIVFAGKTGESVLQNPLLEVAIIKSRTMEEISRIVGRPELADMAYLTGIFSLMPVILQKPIPEILDKLSVGQDIRDALMGGEGFLRNLLDIISALYASNYEKLNSILVGLEKPLDITDVLKINSEAILYYEELRQNGL